MTANPYLDAYLAQLEHERASEDPFCGPAGAQPSGWCRLAARRCDDCRGRRDMVRVWAWGVPNDAALDTIAEHGPIVEIGAGGGYWAKLLRSRGVDVVAYDPDPVTGPPHLGGAKTGQDMTERWSNVSHSDVLLGDHGAVAHHSDRTLLLVWPSYDEPWTDRVLDLYAGDTVIYVGEGAGGCTGTGRMHALLGEQPYCWHDGPDDPACDCAALPEQRFKQVADVEIPQWWGLHDRLGVYRRLPAVA
ncbi:MAG: hypothetical protein AB7W59_01775 [Acidimicrobiia bacterium]